MHSMNTCCFTGHRAIASEELPVLIHRLEHTIAELIGQGVVSFACGGALGFDTMAALAVLKLRQKFMQIQLILFLPHKGQARGWSKKDSRTYAQILSKADKIIYTSEYYYAGCMHRRNRSLVEGSTVCVCYLNRAEGGTAYTVDFAKRRGLRIINLALA